MFRLFLGALALLIVGGAPAFAIERPALDAALRPVDDAFRISLRAGWHAHCVLEANEDISIDKHTDDDGGVVLKAVVEGGEPQMYGVQLYLDGEGQAADVDVFEIGGHPLDDATYFILREDAMKWLPEAEFIGRMSDDIAEKRSGAAPSNNPNNALDLTLAVTVDGLATIDGEDYLVVRRDGSLSGAMDGQNVHIRFAALTRVHRESGLIAEQVMHTEMRSSTADPVIDRVRTTCDITSSDD